MKEYYDKETDILTEYYFPIKDIEIQVKFDDRWCPGTTSSLYLRRTWHGRRLVYTTVDCAKELLWTPPTFTYLDDGIEIGYWVDGYMHYEMLATEEEVNELASRAVYDGQNVAHIAVTHKLSIGTTTVWLKVVRDRQYKSFLGVNVRFCVEFANSEECTRFLHEDMRKLACRYIDEGDSDVAVIDNIIRALRRIHDGHFSTERNAAQRRIPFSQFADEYPQPDTQLIHCQASNRGDDRRCFVTLQLSTQGFYHITRVDWSATTIPPTFPSPSGTFRSLNSLHLRFSTLASKHRKLNPSSHPHQDDDITFAADEISSLEGTNSPSAGNYLSIDSVHRTVKVNIHCTNAIMGDGYFGTISGGNVGGRGNHIHVKPPPASRLPTEQSRAQGLLLAQARRRPQPQPQPRGAKPPTRGVARCVKARPQWRP